jgi:SnoaL-like domain
MSRLVLGVALAAAMVVLPVACGGGLQEASVPAAAGITSPTTAPPGATVPRQSAGTTAAQVIRRHLDAVGRGDLTTYLTTVAEDARFEIGGRILSGREEIRGFAESDLFDPNGRYEILSLTQTPEGAVLDLDFRRGSLHERLNYRYSVRDGQIRELVARYR